MVKLTMRENNFLYISFLPRQKWRKEHLRFQLITISNDDFKIQAAVEGVSGMILLPLFKKSHY
jgi:hypothetical protein